MSTQLFKSDIQNSALIPSFDSQIHPFSPSPKLPGIPFLDVHFNHNSVFKNHCKALQKYFPASSLSCFGKTANSCRGKFNSPNMTFKVFQDQFSTQFSRLASQLPLWHSVFQTLTQLSSVRKLHLPSNSLTDCVVWIFQILKELQLLRKAFENQYASQIRSLIFLLPILWFSELTWYC